VLFTQINLIDLVTVQEVGGRHFNGKSFSAGGDSQNLVDGIWHQHVCFGEREGKEM